ncbi:MAG: hypothetical protein UIG59_08650 [Acutalibacteraceae bacterium]|nr:hypothetical protein [Acutalibacteraceae bacterium]
MNKKSETLRQREKAQKDLLELKKMQRGDIDPSILKDDDKKITPKTPDEKIENFFFYHKYKLLFAAAVAVVLAIIITSAITTPKYDATLTIYCYEYVADSEIEDVEGWMNKGYTDTNGNQRVDVLVTDCSFAPNTDLADTVHQRQLKIQSILTDPKSMLFILDKESLTYLNSISDNFTLFEEENVVLLGEDFYKNLDGSRNTLKADKDRYLCLRTVAGSALEGKAEKNYSAAKEFIENLKK